MKYKRYKSAYCKYMPESSSSFCKKKNPVRKICSFVILVSVGVFLASRTLSFPFIEKAFENSKAAVYFEKAVGKIKKGGESFEKLGEKGAEYIFNHLISDNNESEKVYAVASKEKKDLFVSSDAKETEAIKKSFCPVMPCEGEISSPYGQREHPVLGQSLFHNGIDIAVETGTLVRAIEDGKIEKATYNQYSGNFVVISHCDGYTSSYAHLAEVKVCSGQEVKKGEVIGLSGSTGTATGPHLHMEVRKEGEPVDPLGVICDA